MQENYKKIFEIGVSKEARDLALKYGYLPYMIERYINIFGSLHETIEFLESVEHGLRKSIRCNTLVASDCRVLEERLERRGIIVDRILQLPHGYWVIDGEEKIGHTSEYIYGYYYIQGPGSMTVSYVLDPPKNSVVADLASAPGGKTTHIAQLMNNTGAILSVDKSPARAKALKANIQRMRVENTVVLVEDILRLRDLNGAFEKVLLDAPCSGEGLLPFKAERKRSMTMLEIKRAHELQVRLAKKAVELVREGGILLYATCSIGVEENELVLRELLEDREDIEILPTRWRGQGEPGITEYMGVNLGSELKRCMRLYPHKHKTEGFFLCLVKRK